MNSAIAAYVVEFERRFRERTPAQDVLAALPEYRVGRSEMQTWWEAQGYVMTLDTHLELHAALKPVFRRLKREFPDERW